MKNQKTYTSMENEATLLHQTDCPNRLRFLAQIKTSILVISVFHVTKCTDSSSISIKKLHFVCLF